MQDTRVTVERWCVKHFIRYTTGVVGSSVTPNDMCVPMVIKLFQFLRKRRYKSVRKTVPIIKKIQLYINFVILDNKIASENEINC